MNIVGLLLAGGQSRRMGGGDKALRLLGGRSLLERVIERLRPQVAALDCAIVASVATDAPFLPEDLVSRLVQGMEAAGAELACAASGGQAHPVIGLWPVRLRAELRRALVDEDIRKVDVWTARYRLATVPFPEQASGRGPAVDPFFNANRPEDLDRAAALLGHLEL